MVASDKYFSGQFAICRTCGARPCLCDATPATAADELAPRRRRDSGNAIPFALWDYIIGDYGLSVIEHAAYGYLCRETFGRGKHGGAPLSLNAIAAAIRVSRASTARALAALGAHGLIERTQLTEPDSNEPAATHIRVIVPPKR